MFRLPELSRIPCVTILALALTGCASAPPPVATTSDTGPPTVASIAGSWDVAVELLDNACGSVTVMPQPTSVSRAEGADGFVLRHGGLAFRAALGADGAFAAAPLTLRDQDGSTLTVLLSGRFTSAAALDATVTVRARGRSRPPRDCDYTVRWLGRRR